MIWTNHYLCPLSIICWNQIIMDLFVLKKIKEGDIKAFESIFRLYYTPLCLYATSITGEQEVAEEIVQDLLCILERKRISSNLTFHQELPLWSYPEPVLTISGASGSTIPIPEYGFSRRESGIRIVYPARSTWVQRIAILGQPGIR